MAREEIPYKTSYLVTAGHPIDLVNNNPLDNTVDSAVCSFKVFDPNKDETISAVEAIGQTILSVTNAGAFEDADTIEIEQDNGTFHFSPIITGGVDTVNQTITITAGLTVAAAIGNTVRKLFGPAITMSEFGTPNVDETDWGFRAVYPTDHTSQIVDQEIDIEITFLGTGTAAGGLDVLDIICAVIKKNCVNVQ